MDEADAAFVEEFAVGVVRVDDDEALLVELEVAFDQRQGPFADRSEADHHDRAGDASVLRPMRHGVRSPLMTSDAERPGRRLKPWRVRRVNSAGGGVSVAKRVTEWASLTDDCACFRMRLRAPVCTRKSAPCWAKQGAAVAIVRINPLSLVRNCPLCLAQDRIQPPGAWAVSPGPNSETTRIGRRSPSVTMETKARGHFSATPR